MTRYTATFIILFLFIGLSDIDIPTFNMAKAAKWQREPRNEGYVAYIVNESVSNISAKSCDCNGDKVIKTGDGRQIPCPCTNCTCKREGTGSNVGSIEPQNTASEEKKTEWQMYLFTDLVTCGHCIVWNREQKPILVKNNWGVNNNKDSLIREFDVSDPANFQLMTQYSKPNADGRYSTPTFIMLKDGKPVEEIKGAISARAVTDLWYKWDKK